ncbi:hypothetical protein SDC9_133735 [bioreactor metagenome]|uniref:Uncharacterized protein n=1 Tax=bioreactor metagenome TaxID=1076179 RepID=A0A645DBS9_9ZZZZ
MRDRRHHHRRRRRGRALRRKIQARRRRHHTDRNPLLVLRLRNHGHGPPYRQGRLGLQRHRTARRGLSGGGAGRPRPEGPACLRHLRPRRAERRRRRNSRRRRRKIAAVRPRRHRGRGNARQKLSFHRQRFHGHRRFDPVAGALRTISRHAL